MSINKLSNTDLYGDTDKDCLVLGRVFSIQRKIAKTPCVVFRDQCDGRFDERMSLNEAINVLEKMIKFIQEY